MQYPYVPAGVYSCTYRTVCECVCVRMRICARARVCVCEKRPLRSLSVDRSIVATHVHGSADVGRRRRGGAAGRERGGRKMATKAEARRRGMSRGVLERGEEDGVKGKGVRKVEGIGADN